MEYIASKRLIHRDLAARNILLMEQSIAKISDFGLCCACDDASFIYQGSKCKKLPVKWLALETLLQRSFSEKSDVWSYGVLMFEVYSGGQSPYAMLENDRLIGFLSAGKRLDKPEGASDG